MFGFDRLVHGVRGYQLPDISETEMAEEELEVFGVDWEGLHDEQLLDTRQQNNSRDTGSASWIGRRGPPDNLNGVPVGAPNSPFDEQGFFAFQELVQPALGGVDVVQIWVHGLSVARSIVGDLL